MKTLNYTQWIFILLCCTCLKAVGQSTTQNYIVSKVMTDNTGAKSRDVVQYYDGLGRPVETVRKQFTPAGYDLVSCQEYDNFGRESLNWLPGASNQNTGNFVDPATVKTLSKASNKNDSRSFGEVVYEPSPLNRINAQFGPGEAWKTNNRAVRTEYLTNTVTDSLTSCIFFYLSEGYHFGKRGKYPAGELFVTKTTDEDNHVSYEFKDKLGQVILQRQLGNANLCHDTYYIYEDNGTLHFVLTPRAVDYYSPLPDRVFNIWNSNDNKGVNDYMYVFESDSRNRRALTKNPTTGHVSTVFDKSDRLIFRQDAMQEGHHWTFYKYDQLGRLIFSGIKEDATNYYFQRVNNQNFLFIETYTGTSGPNYGYSNISPYPVNAANIHTVNYYDNHNWLNLLPAADKVALTYVAKANYGTPHPSAQGLLTGNRQKLLDGSQVETITAYYYDFNGRVIQSLSKNHSGGYEKQYFAYNFDGSVAKKLTELSVNGQPTISESYEYLYDAIGRLASVTYKLNNETPIQMSAYTYNDLGQVASKKIGEGKAANSYSYNIRGWMESNAGSKFSQDLFYNNASQTGGTGCFNGNISAIRSMIGTETLKGYNFFYDPLDRLASSNYGEGTNLGTAKDRFNESLTFDKNGNIKTLKRRGLKVDGSYGLIDDLVVTAFEGNLQSKIEDYAGSQNLNNQMEMNSNPSDWPYWSQIYNPNACVLSDAQKKLCMIEYNFLNLPQRVQHKEGHVAEFAYDASGVKRKAKYQTTKNLNLAYWDRKELSPADILNTLVTNYYGNKVYENDALKRIYTEEGYIAKEGNLYKAYYYLKDHLGSIRAVMDEAGNVVQKNYYYPFGLLTVESTTQEKQPLKYNGKELEKMQGMNWYDYSARLYDPVTARFLSPDPMAEKYFNNSQFVYCNNNPVNAIDPDGRSTWVMNNSDGTYRVVGGDLEDKDKNIYVYSIQDGNLVRGESIGESDLISSFYNSDDGAWSTGSIIDPNDSSGKDFFSSFNNEEPAITNYMENATAGGKYDFKRVGATIDGKNDNSTYYYRGMPIRTENGKTIYSSARDIGNYTAGYIAGVIGVPWQLARKQFDKLESKQQGRRAVEGYSTQNAEVHGWNAGVGLAYSNPLKVLRWTTKSIPSGVKWFLNK